MEKNRIASILFGKNFFTGLLVLLPLAVAVYLLSILVNWVWSIHRLLPNSWIPEGSAEDALYGIVVLGMIFLLVLFISFLGWISKQYVGQQILKLIQDLIQKIPVVGTIYSTLNQLLKAVMTDGSGKGQFRRVVYVEFPKKETWAIAFVTGPAEDKALPSGMINIFIPTVPNPTSGFHMIVPESQVKESDLSVEQAFRTILSFGIAKPK